MKTPWLKPEKNASESGFVLVAALTMLSLLTLMVLGMFHSSKSATQTSGVAQTSTEAYYYAETAVNYISWAMANDAELDSFQYSTGAYQHGAFNEPPTVAAGLNTSVDGDYREWGAFMWHPGPLTISDSGDGIVGQVKYFDNSPMDQRALCFEDATVFPNCIDVSLSTGDAKRKAAEPSLFQISVGLPRYIKLEIASDGSITPSIPQLPHRGPTSTPVAGPVVGEDIPNNGAIVWLTAGDPNNANRDIEIYPLDPSNILNPNNPVVYGGALPPPTACLGGSMAVGDCPCDYSGTYGGVAINLGTDVACDAHANASALGVVGGAYDTNGTGANNVGQWTTAYRIVAYAIGYVNGRPSHLIRSVIR